MRLLPWPTVVGDTRIVFFGMDPWYHMRRVAYALANGGEILAFDRYVNHPQGASPIWSPLFDGVTALALSPVYAFAPWRTVELAAALVPPILGAACVVATWWLARKLFAPRVAALAGLLLCFLSAHFWYSQLGFLDHHVAIALLATLLLSSAVSLFLRTAPSSPPLRETWTGYAALGALAAFCLLVWPGTVLHVALVEIALLAFAATRAERVDAVRAASGAALAAGVGLAIVLPASHDSAVAQWGAYSPVVLSRFQPLLFASLAAHAALCAAAWGRARLGASRVARAALGAALGGVILAVLALAIPGLVAGAGDAWRWLARDEVFQRLVSESQPLFAGKDGFDPSNAVLRLSRLVWLFPLAWLALAARARASARRPAVALLLFYAAGLAGATVLQRRFFNSFSPVFAIVVAWACVEACVAAARVLGSALGGSRAARAAGGGLAAVAVLWLFAPTLAAYRVPVANLTRAEGAPLAIPNAELARRRMLDAAEWLRESTPPTSGYLDADAAPEYGVLAPWGYGHLLKYVAQRPTVVGNFGDDVGERNLRRVEAYFRSDEPDASPILEDLRARYVVVETLARAGPGQLERRAMRSRLSLDDGPGLERHRLVWESPLDGTPRPPRSELRIFEHVAGAVVTGSAPPGARVRASLGYTSNRGRRGTYETATVADDRGRYRLRVPYATRGAPPGVDADAAYRLRADGRTGSVVVDEQAVERGATVAGPTFGAARSDGDTALPPPDPGRLAAAGGHTPPPGGTPPLVCWSRPGGWR